MSYAVQRWNWKPQESLTTGKEKTDVDPTVDVKEDVSVGKPARSRLTRLIRPALILAACALLTVGGYCVWQTWFAEDGSTNIFLTAMVTRGNLEDTVTATGTLQPKEFVDVGTQASGQLKKLLVDIGAVVKAGQLLAEIDLSVYQAKVDGDHAQLLNQRAQIRLSRLQAADGKCRKAKAYQHSAHERDGAHVRCHTRWPFTLSLLFFPYRKLVS